MKVLHMFIASAFTFYAHQAIAAQTQNYGGDLSFAVTSNVSAVSFETNVTDFKAAKAEVEGGKLMAAQVELDPATFETGLSMRDDHMNEKVFKEKPVVVNLKECESSSATTCRAKGEIEIAGVKKEITFDLTHDPEFKNITGETKLSLKELDIAAPSYMGVVIEDQINVKFKLSSK